MKQKDALNQLCKMVSEIGLAINPRKHTPCICGEAGTAEADVPDRVIQEMWKAVCNQRDEINHKRAMRRLEQGKPL